MKKILLSVIIAFIFSLNAIACDFPIITSCCLKASFHSTETIEMSFSGLCSTNVYIWIHTGSGYSSSDFLELNSSSPIVSLSGVGTYLFTISSSQVIPLDQCYSVFTGTNPSDAPYIAYNPVFYQLCPCVTGACYIDDPNSTDPLIIDLQSPAAGPSSLYLWVDAGMGAGPEGYFSTTGVGTFNGSNYDHLVTCNTLGYFYDAAEFNHACIPIIYVSDIWMDPITTSTDHPEDWAMPFSTICPCPSQNLTPQSKYQGGCVLTDPITYLSTVSVQTDNPSISYMWFESLSGMATSISVIANSGPGLPWIATFNFTTIGGGICPTPECHNFYFSSTPTDPRPNEATRLLICPCGAQTPPNTNYMPGCLSLDASYWATVTVETNNGITPNYMWFEGMSGMAVQFGPAVPNPLWPGTPGELPFIVSFDFATIGGGISPTMICHNYYFSSTPIDPRPTVASLICPCQGEGNPGQRSSNTVSGNANINLENLNNVNIYPNPANGNVTVTFNLMNQSDIQIDITDQIGRTIKILASQRMQSGKQKINFNTYDLTDGIYFIRIQSDKQTMNNKLTVIK